MGAVMKLCLERRGVNSSFSYPSPGRVEMSFEMPLAEVIYRLLRPPQDRHPGLRLLRLRTASDYRRQRPGEAGHPGERREGGRPVHDRPPGQGPGGGVQVCDRLKEEIPRQQFKIAIQGAIGGKIISRVHHLGLSQGRHRQVLRRRHHPQAQTPGKTAGRQKTHEDGRAPWKSPRAPSWRC